MAKQQKGFRVTAITKLAHTTLLNVAKKYGSAKLAKKLGISVPMLRDWIYMRKMPDARFSKPNVWCAVEKLTDITGEAAEILFPSFIKDNLTGETLIRLQTKEIDFSQLTGESKKQLTYEENFEEIDNKIDAEEQFKKVLVQFNKLTDREQLILKLRYGLDGSKVYTLKEVGKLLDLSPERIREIQRYALNKLHLWMHQMEEEIEGK